MVPYNKLTFEMTSCHGTNGGIIAHLMDTIPTKVLAY